MIRTTNVRIAVAKFEFTLLIPIFANMDVKAANKVGYGYNALTEEYTDMMEAGIVDPTKVTRSALENAASVAAMVLTTESLVADKKEENAPAMPAGGMGN